MTVDASRWEHIPNCNAVCDVQGAELYRLARGSRGPIVEIGSHRGRSTSWLAAGAVDGQGFPVYAIDPWDPKKCNLPTDMHTVTQDEFQSNIERAGFDEVVRPVPELAQDVWMRREPADIFEHPLGVLFLDGDHSERSVLRDLEWVDAVMAGGAVVLHDYGGPIPGPMKAMLAFEAARPNVLRWVRTVVLLGVFEKMGGSAE